MRETPVGEVAIEQLDATEDVPLRTVCWLEKSAPEKQFEEALAEDGTVEEATQVVATDRGYQYHVTHDQRYPGAEVYYAAVEQAGSVVSGTTDGEQWVLRLRFPDRASFTAFTATCEEDAPGMSVLSVHERETAPAAEQYQLSTPQREVLTLAVERGYFEVPRQASLADLAADLGISSQAASERLRRGLDSLVERALLTPE